jgi:hypothetical protein
MVHIMAGILTLVQHLSIQQENSKSYTPNCCPHCGKSTMWFHGYYSRKADRSKMGELNPIFIPRYFCPYCQKTCSVLPECLPPRRWYLWCVQQLILKELILNKSLHSVSQSATLPAEKSPESTERLDSSEKRLQKSSPETLAKGLEATTGITGQSVSPSRSTCRRWWNHFKTKFLFYREALCAHISELGRHSDLNSFWSSCFSQMSLDRAMLLCHLAGVLIP